MRQVWTVRLGQQAEQDYVEILQWTVKTFSEDQTNSYPETIALAIESLEGGADTFDSRAREDIQPGIWTLHVARQGRAGRHFVVFRAATDDEVMHFIERHSLHGKGIGVVDIHLLASVALAGGTMIWTRDQKLRQAAATLGCAFPEPAH